MHCGVARRERPGRVKETAMTETSGVPVEYQRAFDDLEKRAARGEVTLAQAKQEIFALREKFSCGLPTPMYLYRRALAS
jgi:hypothetical protein